MSNQSFEAQLWDRIEERQVDALVKAGMPPSGSRRLDDAIQQVTGIYKAYTQQRTEITNAAIDGSVKQQRYAELSRKFTPTLTNAAQVIYGNIERGQWELGSYRLTEDGMFWQEVRAAEKTLQRAEQRAEEISAPGYAAAVDRAKTIFANIDLDNRSVASSDQIMLDLLMNRYASATPDQQAAIQNVWPLMLVEKFGKGQTGPMRQALERDRNRRVNTTEVQQARQALNNVHQAGFDALRVTEELTEQLGISVPQMEGYLGFLPRLMAHQNEVIRDEDNTPVGVRPRLMRTYWGVAWVNGQAM